jgi:hypothetical protein
MGVPETVLPVQFHPACPTSPEKRLCLAVLEDAISVLQGDGLNLGSYGNQQHSRVKARLQREAHEWFASDDTDFPFSFMCVCEALGIEATWLRKRVLAGMNFKLPRQGHGSKHGW